MRSIAKRKKPTITTTIIDKNYIITKATQRVDGGRSPNVMDKL